VRQGLVREKREKVDLQHITPRAKQNIRALGYITWYVAAWSITRHASTTDERK
jgi:hypothetical protein